MRYNARSIRIASKHDGILLPEATIAQVDEATFLRGQAESTLPPTVYIVADEAEIPLSSTGLCVKESLRS